MFSSYRTKLVVLATLLAVLLGVKCNLPPNPFNSSNTDVTPFIKTIDGAISFENATDSAGKRVMVSAALTLPFNFSTLSLSITQDGQAFFDTIFNIVSEKVYADTIQIPMIFYAPGIYVATFTPVSNPHRDPVSVKITVLSTPDMPPNHKPVIGITGNTVLKPGETCVLKLSISDPDSGQILTPSINGLPAEAQFTKDVFSWSVPTDFAGYDTVEFIVYDNGYPKMADTEIVIITVTQTPHVPSIEVRGNTTVKSGQVCTLTLVIFDQDVGQNVAVTMSGAPEDAKIIRDSLFIWTVSESALPSYDIVFRAIDNGVPPLSATKTITLTVISEHKNNPPKWDIDTLPVTLFDTSSYQLTLSQRCSDADSDSLSWVLVPVLPEIDSIKNGVYFFNASVLTVGSFYPAIIASDRHGASDTLYLKMVVKQLPIRAVQLSSISFSSGTLREKTAPVPDTLRDTVSYADSSIRLSFELWDNTSSITVQEKMLPVGTKTTHVAVPVGSVGVPLKIESADKSLEKTYSIIIVRKPNSTEPLTTAPTGLKIDSVGSSWIRIKWNDLSGALSYIVERSKTDDKAFLILDTLSSNTLTDSGLSSGTVYYYRVKAFNSVSVTTFCEPVSGSTLAKPSITQQPGDTVIAIGKPLSLKCTASGPSIQIQWRKNGVALAGKTTTELAFSEISIIDTGTYSIKIWSGEDSVISNPFKISVLPAKPSVITAIARSAFSVSVSWTAADGAQKYIVLRAAGSGTYTQVSSLTDASFVDTLLLEGTQYNYRVIAGNNAGNSDTSSIASVTTWKGPVITTDLPATLSLNAGQQLNLSVETSGTPQCTYQWQKNGVLISGATTASFSIDQVEVTDSGTYLVIITNSVRAVTSKQVKVSVKPVYRLQLVPTPAAGGSIAGGKDSSYVSGTQLTLTAVPKTGYAFKYWGTNVSATSASIQIIMNKDTVITANFIRQFTLTMNTIGAGSTSPASGASVVVDSGVPTTISATPGTASKFSSWSSTAAGVVFGSSTAASTTVKLTQANAVVQAVFKGYTFNNNLPLSEFSSVYLQKVITGTDSGYYVVGAADEQGLIIRLNSQGGVVWKKRYQYSTGLNSITPLGTEYILAASSNNGTCVMKIAGNGNEITTWCHAYDEGKFAVDVKPVTDGFILAVSASGPVYIVKLSNTGDSLWTKTFQPGSYDNFNGCIILNDNNVLAFGRNSVGSSAYVLKTNSSGTKIWDDIFENYFYWSAHGTGVNSAIEITDGYVFAGSSNPTSGNPTTTVGTLMKTTTAGAVSWTKYYDYFRNLKKVVQTGNNFVIAGDTYTKGPGECDMLLAKTSATGDTLWSRAFGTAIENEQCISMDMAKDGGFILLGSTGMIVKTDENGIVE